MFTSMLNLTHLNYFVLRDCDLDKINMCDLSNPQNTKTIDDCDVYLICSRERVKLKPQVMQFPIIDFRFVYIDIEINNQNNVKSKFKCRLDVKNEVSYLGGGQIRCITEFPYDELILINRFNERVRISTVSMHVRIANQIPEECSLLRVLYVGQSQRGKKFDNGSIRNRIQKHEKFQKIALDLLRHEPHKEIILVLLALQFDYWGIMMFGDSEKMGMKKWEGNATADDFFKRPLSNSLIIDLTEGILINTFKPKYNDKLKCNLVDNKLKLLDECREKKYSGISFELNTIETNFKLYSESVPSSSFHTLTRDISSNKNDVEFWFFNDKPEIT